MTIENNMPPNTETIEYVQEVVLPDTESDYGKIPLTKSTEMLHSHDELLHTAVWAYRQGVLEFLSLGLEGLKAIFGEKKVTTDEKSGIFALGAKALFDMMNGAYDKVEDETLRENFANLMDTILNVNAEAETEDEPGEPDDQDSKTESQR